MNQNKRTYVKNILFPCLLVSSVAGIFTGVIIFLFKLCATEVIHLSEFLYHAVRQTPALLPLLIIGAALIGLLATLILKYEPSARGGGIPSAIAILRDLISFHWLKNIIAVFASAMLTYLGGVPLGTEGPSVQMGTAAGRGVSRLFCKNSSAWDRYVMTGSACAGFSCATGAPITGIFFAFEEAHRRFSLPLFLAVASSVVAGYATTNLLCNIADLPIRIFDYTIDRALPLHHIWVAIAIGVISGIAAILFTKLYELIGKYISNHLSKLSLYIRIPTVFALTALIGFASAQLIGTGHGLIETLLEGNGLWYMFLICLAVRAILLIVANSNGISGGLFIPTLAFGALIGAFCANLFIGLGLIGREHYVIMLSIGMATYLAASSRTPLMAIAFAAEALGCITNLLPVITGVNFACLIIEAAHVACFTDTVIETRVKQERAGKTATVIDEHVTVAEGAFVIEKEIHDILWPPTCTILSVSKAQVYSAYDDGGLQPGDVLHLHYITYDPDKTHAQLEALVGKQKNKTDPTARIHVADENHQVPQL